MKILLVAPSTSKEKFPGINNLLGMNLHPKYGLLLLGSIAEDLGHDVRYLDESFENIPYNGSFDLVGITCLTNKARRAYDIAEHFRRKGVLTVVGGVHPSVCPSEAKEYADAVVIGEAEGVWPIVLEDLKKGQLKPFYKSKDGLLDLRKLPKIRYNLIPRQAYYLHPGVTEATRGCPHNCEFCSTRFFGRTYRRRPVDHVLEDISRSPDNYIVFMDDNLMGDKTYAIQLFSALCGFGKIWTGHATIDIVNHPELLRVIHRSGCRNLVIGFDSINSKNLEIANKRVNLGINYDEAVKKIHENGIDIIASFILGFDYDDERSFVWTYDFVSRNRIFLPTFWVLTPYPGTKLYQRLRLENRITELDWDLYDSRHLTFKPLRMKPEVFVDNFSWLEKHTFSWGNIWHRSSKANDQWRNKYRKLRFNSTLKIARSLGMVRYGE